MKFIINTDGGARGNPGPAGIGVVIRDEAGKIVSEHGKFIGDATNNFAEYRALILALDDMVLLARDHYGQAASEVTLEIRMDSELIVKQMLGQYKIKEPTLKILAGEVLEKLKQFKRADFKHVRREFNKEADKLVNNAIDGNWLG